MSRLESERTGVPSMDYDTVKLRYEQYQLLFEKAADVIYSVDTDLRLLYVSPSVEKHLGYMPQELTGKPFTELGLLTEDSLARAIEDTMRIMNGEELKAAEYDLIAKDGTVRCAEVRSTPVYRNGRVASIVSVARDITAQRHAEQALAASEKRFRTMAESLTDGLLIMEEGRIVYVNDCACRLCGYSREELVQLWGPDLTAPQSMNRKDHIPQKISETGAYPEQSDIWITRKDGMHCCLNLRFAFDYSAEKKQSGYVLITDITERIRSQEKIRDTLYFLDSIIDSSLDAIVIGDAKGVIYRVNQAFLDMIGRSMDEVYGKFTRDFSVLAEGSYELTSGEHIEIGREYLEYTQAKVSQFISEKRIVNWENYMFHRSGKIIPVDVTIVFLFDRNGVTTGTFGILRDTTQRRKAEKEITETRDFLNNIIESSLDPIVIGDNRGYITRVNKAFIQLVGFEQEELIGKHMAELVPPQAGIYESTAGTSIILTDSFCDRVFEQMKKLMERGDFSAGEAYYCDKNGKIIPVEQTLFYIYDKKGECTGVVSVSRDISERKKAEQKLVETRNFLEDIIRTSADGIVVTDALGNLILANEAVTRILDYSQEELLGRNIRDFMVSDDLNMWDNFIESASCASEPVLYYETKWQVKGQRLIELGANMSILRDISGSTTGMVACIRDITKQKAAERRLYEYQDQLRSLASQLTMTEEQERRHIASEIHDRIGQSLALAKIRLGVLGAARDARERNSELSGIRELLEQSIRDTRSLIFNLSPPFLYEFGLEKALEWLIDDMQKEYGLRTRLVCTGAEGILDDDVRILLYQSIRELLINVVKHAHAKTATVLLDQNAQMIHITVEDDGKGFVISPDGFKVSNRGGYGIFSVRERFEHLGGTLTVESKLNRGTRINMELSLLQHQADTGGGL